MGAVSLWTRLQALYLCTGPQKAHLAAQLSRPTAGPHRCMSTATPTTEQKRPSFNKMQLWDLNCLLTACTRGICCACTTQGVEHLVNGLQLEKRGGNWTKGICICATTGCRLPGPSTNTTSCTVGSRRESATAPRQGCPRPRGKHNRGTRKSTAQGSLYGLPNRENHENRPLHHDRDVDDQR